VDVPHESATRGTAEQPSGGFGAVSWPLVERRQRADSPPGGVDRRGSRRDLGEVPSLSATPLWPFRIGALAGAAVRVFTESGLELDSWRLWICTAVITVYTTIVSLRPIAYRDDQTVRTRILAEQALITIIALVSGAWSSPFVLCLIPTGMLAAFAAGAWFSMWLATISAVAITVQHVPEAGVRAGLQDAALWAGLLSLVAFTSGLAHRAAVDSMRQQEEAFDRVNRLAEANSLLFALTRVAQTLPASLDLDDVLNSTVGRVRSMIDYEALVVYLFNEADQTFDPIRTYGAPSTSAVAAADLANGLVEALAAPKTVRVDNLAPGAGVDPASRSGLYAALRARGALVGLIAIEAHRPHAFGPQHAEVIHGLAEPFGIAMDNARLFRQIRTLAADEERARIARDLHDRVGSSLALIGFSVDRASSVASSGDAVEPVLAELRDHVRSVVVDVRDTLYDLRAEITQEHDLARTTSDFLKRFQERTGITTKFSVTIEGRIPVPHERELWQILRESMVNVERHSQATDVTIELRETPEFALLRITDNGVGMGNAPSRPDSYGIIGMRERATNIGATFSVNETGEGGTEVRVYLPAEGSTRRGGFSPTR
jgi:signal transduction histidine kinase